MNDSRYLYRMKADIWTHTWKKRVNVWTHNISSYTDVCECIACVNISESSVAASLATLSVVLYWLIIIIITIVWVYVRAPQVIAQLPSGTAGMPATPTPPPAPVPAPPSTLPRSPWGHRFCSELSFPHLEMEWYSVSFCVGWMSVLFCGCMYVCRVLNMARRR